MQAEIRSQVRKFCEDNGFTNDEGLWFKRGSNWMCYVTIPRGEVPRMCEVDVVYWIMTDTQRYEKSMRIQAHLFVEIIEGVLQDAIKRLCADVWSKVLFNE